ncbi:aminopeptidase P family protein [Prochlorothrix hollandica]|uniref:aminopeptidase P family protein n=1 Tax=Prochlorothrix hollandica TaxID=1223 RepID=UPI0003475C9A|nr:aminopeptidase P family protein [Prochlorothrix hollandica]
MTATVPPAVVTGSPSPALIPYGLEERDRQDLRHRRQRLGQHLAAPVLLWSGGALARNFPANVLPFRASSHFLYFAGIPLQNAVIALVGGEMTLYLDDAPEAATLWHGESPRRQDWAEYLGAIAHFPLADLGPQVQDQGQQWATIAPQDPLTRQHQEQILGRRVGDPRSPHALDLALTEVVISLRLSHDRFALAQLEAAAAVSMQAHGAALAATVPILAQGGGEAAVRSALEAVMIRHNMTPAYSSIVTVQGEVLHNDHYHHPLQPGDLLLVDGGAETALGWAADITRTWPVSGRFSPSQRAIYAVVLAAHDACIAALKPGVEYEAIHLLACEVLAQGLVDLGILRGQPLDLVAADAHALFFPHGVGHLLGLDVHDMEDLGDRAGYAPGRVRSDRFGLGYLRLHRPLQAGMVVTIEPGFYQVPALLEDPQRRDRYRHQVNWERLAEFADVRGIRIEDDVLITEAGCRVLTAALPTAIAALEALLNP